MLKRFALLTTLALGSVAFAHATTISQISIDGSDSFTSSGNTGTVTFYNPASVGAGATGAFSAFTSADNDVVIFPAFPDAPLPYTLGNNSVMANLGVPTVLALATTQGTNTLDFYMSSYTVSVVSDIIGCSEDCLDVTGNGYFTVNGGPDANGSFTFTTQAVDLSGDTEVTFSATGYETPEPASLLLLGTGLISVVGIARSRMRPANVSTPAA